MNKKEISEIRKNFTNDSNFFVMEKVLTAYVDAEKNIKFTKVQPCIEMPDDDFELYINTLKKILSSGLGKAVNEYEFPNEAYDPNGSQTILYDFLQSAMEDEEKTTAFVENIVKNIQYQQNFAIISAHCTYSVRSKSKNDEYNGDNDSLYRFIITAICPVNTGNDGFAVDSIDERLLKKENSELLVNKLPSDGFLYPVFSSRSTDVNHVLYYTKTPNKPNVSIIEDVLGCKFVMSPQSEKEKFRDVLQSVVGDDLDYTLITTVNDMIREVIDENSDETEIPSIDDTKLKSMLQTIGVSSEKLLGLEAVYKETVGENALIAANLVEPKTVVSIPDITVNIKKDGTGKLRTATVNGRKCLLIDLDDPNIEVNGLPATI